MIQLYLALNVFPSSSPSSQQDSWNFEHYNLHHALHNRGTFLGDSDLGFIDLPDQESLLSQFVHREVIFYAPHVPKHLQPFFIQEVGFRHGFSYTVQSAFRDERSEDVLFGFLVRRESVEFEEVRNTFQQGVFVHKPADFQVYASSTFFYLLPLK